MSAALHRDPDAGALEGITLPVATFDLDAGRTTVDAIADGPPAEAPLLGPPDEPMPAGAVAAVPVLERPQADPARRPAPSRALVLLAGLGSVAAHAAVIVALGQLAPPPGLEGTEAPIAVVMVEQSIERVASAPAASEPAEEVPIETADPVEPAARADPAPVPEVADAAPAEIVEADASEVAAVEPDTVLPVESESTSAPDAPPREMAPDPAAVQADEVADPVPAMETPDILAAETVAAVADATPLPVPERAEAVEAPPAEIVEESFADLPVALAMAPTPRPDLVAERRAAERRTAEREQARREERERQAAAPQTEPRREQAQPQPRRQQAPAQAAAPSRQAAAAASPGEQDRYARSLLRHVERHKRYPREAERARISGAARLAVTIDRSGGLAGARLAGSSGHAVLDQEAIAVARRAAPYPRPPEGVGGSTFSFTVTLRFGR